MRIIIEVLDGSSTTQIAMTAIAPSCVICFLVIEKPCDRFLVHSRSHFHVQKEIQDLAVVVRTEIFKPHMQKVPRPSEKATFSEEKVS